MLNALNKSCINTEIVKLIQTQKEIKQWSIIMVRL